MSDDLCAVCGRLLDRNRAVCNQCGGEYHLALRTDADTEDCGDAWIDEDVQALVFGCNRCLGRIKPAAAAPKRYARRTDGSAKSVARARRRPGRA